MKIEKKPTFVVAVSGNLLIKGTGAVIFLLLLIFSVSGFITSLSPEYRLRSASVNTAATNITGKVLYQLMGRENHLFLASLPEDERTFNLPGIIFKLSTNVSLDDPRSLLGRELPGFSLYDGKILVAGEGTNYTNIPIESAPPMEVLKEDKEAKLQNVEDIMNEHDSGEEPYLSTGDKKVVYLYFTHTRESFLPYLKGVTDPDEAMHSQINVTKIGDYLQKYLQDFGIGAVVDKTDITGKLQERGWNYARSYEASREIIEAAVTGNKDLTYFIDIHRDSRRRKDTTKTIGGKTYAKLAFVIGAENPNYEKNLKLAKEIHLKMEEKYPGLSRGIIEKKGAHTNGKFNQDLSGNALLVEFGGVDNTFEELENSARAFADVFAEIYWQAERVDLPREEPAEKQ